MNSRVQQTMAHQQRVTNTNIKEKGNKEIEDLTMEQQCEIFESPPPTPKKKKVIRYPDDCYRVTPQLWMHTRFTHIMNGLDSEPFKKIEYDQGAFIYVHKGTMRSMHLHDVLKVLQCRRKIECEGSDNWVGRQPKDEMAFYETQVSHLGATRYDDHIKAIYEYEMDRISPLIPIQRTVVNHGLKRSLEERAEEEEHDDSVPKAKKKKVTITDKFIDFCWLNKLTSMQDVYATGDQVMLKEMIKIRNLGSLANATFQAIKATLALEPWIPVIIKEIEDWRAENPELVTASATGIPLEWNSRIAQLLTYQEKGDKEIIYLAFFIIGWVDKWMGKRNTLLFSGVPSSGKSQLMDSFVQVFFGNNWGEPGNNTKSEFLFDDCLNCRIVKYEEPKVNMDNIEKLKSLSINKCLKKT